MPTVRRRHVRRAADADGADRRCRRHDARRRSPSPCRRSSGGSTGAGPTSWPGPSPSPCSPAPRRPSGGARRPAGAGSSFRAFYLFGPILSVPELALGTVLLLAPAPGRPGDRGRRARAGRLVATGVLAGRAAHRRHRPRARCPRAATCSARCPASSPPSAPASAPPCSSSARVWSASAAAAGDRRLAAANVLIAARHRRAVARRAVQLRRRRDDELRPRPRRSASPSSSPASCSRTGGRRPALAVVGAERASGLRSVAASVARRRTLPATPVGISSTNMTLRRALVAGEAVGAEGDELVLLDGGAGLDDDVGLHRLAGVRVRRRRPRRRPRRRGARAAPPRPRPGTR